MNVVDSEMRRLRGGKLLRVVGKCRWLSPSYFLVDVYNDLKNACLKFQNFDVVIFD